jgi:protein TonB
MADPWVRPPSPDPPDPGSTPRPEDTVRSSLEKTPSSDDYLLIDRLREEATAGRMDLTSILSESTHAARYFTDASGAALALWSQGVVICRARSGDTAPPLGAKLDVDSGVSGECLRTGRSQRCNDTLTDPRVDSEVCQEMGIRSLAAVPLRGGKGVIGILEVFSDRANAFSDAHITLLKKLAQIAATGRENSTGTTPSTTKESVPAFSAADSIPEPPAIPVAVRKDMFENRWLSYLPARMKGEEGQPLRLAAAAVLLLLLGIFGWMLSRSRTAGSRSDQAVHASNRSTVPPLMAANAVPGARNVPLDDFNEKNASTISLSSGPKPRPDVVAKDVIQKASSSVVTERTSPLRPGTPDAVKEVPANREMAAEVAAPDPAEALSGQGGVAPMPQSVANPQPIFPYVALPVSQGVTGGRLTHKVDPIYPSEARIQRVEGAVILDALVGEDGNVHEVQVTSGQPLLAKAAAQAVRQWRYQPFQLNGKPVSIHNQITIQFKLP